MTINRLIHIISQITTQTSKLPTWTNLYRVGIQLLEPIFGYVQLNDAFCRVERMESVKVKVKDSSIQGKLIKDRANAFI